MEKSRRKNESTSSELRVALHPLRHRITRRPVKHLMACIQAVKKKKFKAHPPIDVI
jgi:hypothetical protein